VTAEAVGIDAIGAEYLTLALEIERIFPGFVDAYMGPDSLRSRANGGPTPDANALLDRANRLLVAVSTSTYDDIRKAFLTAQITGMITTCQKLAGIEIPYEREVATSFDITPEYTPDSVLDESILELDRCLPAGGSVQDRQIAYRQSLSVDTATAARLIDAIMTETRANTRQFVDLPAAESVEIKFVQNQPWSGYNWYLGNGKSRVEINTDLPIYAHNLPALVAHEAYPGHHTEHSLKDLLLYRQRSYAEQGVQLINTPECVVSEGIAVLAEDFGFGDRDGADWLAASLPTMAGLSLDPDLHRRIGTAARNLRAVASNAALLLHRDHRSEREVIQYLQQYNLSTEAEAVKRFSFINDPLWRPYVFTYSVGRTLINRWLGEADQATRLDRFRRLLTEQWTPSRIVSENPT
jgi:hypothetical protein